MLKKSKVIIFLSYLDRILAGESDVGTVDDAEIAELLSLARSMITADFYSDNKNRGNLKKRILACIYKKDKSSFSMLSRNEYELDEEALERVAAGFERQDEEQINMIKKQ